MFHLWYFPGSTCAWNLQGTRSPGKLQPTIKKQYVRNPARAAVNSEWPNVNRKAPGTVICFFHFSVSFASGSSSPEILLHPYYPHGIVYRAEQFRLPPPIGFTYCLEISCIYFHATLIFPSSAERTICISVRLGVHILAKALIISVASECHYNFGWNAVS